MGRKALGLLLGLFVTIVAFFPARWIGSSTAVALYAGFTEISSAMASLTGGVVSMIVWFGLILAVRKLFKKRLAKDSH